MHATSRNIVTAGSARLAAGVAVLGLSLLLVGCSTMGPSGHAELFVRTAPVPTLVRPGGELAAAETAAAMDDSCFALLGAGRSMEPLYASGTAIVVREQSFNTLRAGMAVVYRNARNRYVAHVLIEEGPQGWIASGLNNAAPDDEWVTRQNFVGVVKAAFAAADTPFRAEVASRVAITYGVDRGARVAVSRD